MSARVGMVSIRVPSRSHSRTLGRASDPRMGPRAMSPVERGPAALRDSRPGGVAIPETDIGRDKSKPDTIPPHFYKLP